VWQQKDKPAAEPSTSDELSGALFPDGSNGTNIFKYRFNNYTVIDLVRTYGHAAMVGANLSWFAPNSTACFDRALNMVQYDFDLLMIKLMYGDTKNNILNSTLFLRNASEVGYVCIDTVENLYVYAMYKFKLFGYDWTNVALGALQNALGRILSINKIYEKIMEYDTNGDLEQIYYSVGKIVVMIIDFEPVILEASGFGGTDPDD